jgi:hypothetical protein
VPLYDQVALALLAINAMMALRSIIWFGLGAVIVLTPLVDDLLGATRSLTGKTASRAGARGRSGHTGLRRHRVLVLQRVTRAVLAACSG